MPLYPSRVMGGGHRDTLAGVPFSLEDQEEKGRQTHPSLSVSLALCLCRPPMEGERGGCHRDTPSRALPYALPSSRTWAGRGRGGGPCGTSLGMPVLREESGQPYHFSLCLVRPPIEEDKGGGHRKTPIRGKPSLTKAEDEAEPLSMPLCPSLVRKGTIEKDPSGKPIPQMKRGKHTPPSLFLFPSLSLSSSII